MTAVAPDRLDEPDALRVAFNLRLVARIRALPDAVILLMTQPRINDTVQRRRDVLITYLREGK